MKINNLTILKEFNVGNRKMCLCCCDCGNITTVEKSHLLNGHTKSCGCLAKQKGK